MIVANRTPDAAMVKLRYWRQHLPTGEREVVPVDVWVDDGPALIARAQDVLYERLDYWNRAPNWKFWSGR